MPAPPAKRPGRILGASRRRNAVPPIDGQIFFDLSTFLAHPLRSGIQRVAYQLLRNWRFQPALLPGFVMPETGQAVLLPESFPAAMQHFFEVGTDGAEAARARLADCARDGHPLREHALGRLSAFLNMEAFHEPGRLALYRRLAAGGADRVHFFVHDAFPVLHPEIYPPGTAALAMPYLRLLRRLPNLYFNSAASRRDFCDRILRVDRPTYQILPLGADGLGWAAPEFSTAKRRFACVGTLEPRKNHPIILRVFEALWSRGAAVELSFIGRLGWNASEPNWHAPEIAAELAALSARNPLFTWHEDLVDIAVRDTITASRATIYASEIEGFGLPPLESLALGVPVIASRRVPSIGMIADLGQLRLAEVTAEALWVAVTSMLDDAFAARKYEEIARLELPSWQGFAASLHQLLLRPL